MKKGKSGISLIVMVITIIVMIILAGAIIIALNNNKSIEQANDAVGQYNAAQDKQVSDVSEAKYKIAQLKGEYSGTYEEYYLEKKFGIKIGDYVNYTYDNAEAYILTFGSNTQTINQTKDAKWRILGIDSNRNIKIIPTNTVGDKFYLGNKQTGETLTESAKVDALACNNAVYLINDICIKHYSNKGLGLQARSINMEDIKETLTESAKSKFSTQKIELEKTYINENNEIMENVYYPVIYAEEVGTDINGKDIKEGISNSDPYYKENNLTNLTNAVGKSENKLTLSAYTLPIKPVISDISNSSVWKVLYSFAHADAYWVASRYVRKNADGSASFGIFDAYANTSEAIFEADTIYYTDGTSSGTTERKILPVVTIPSNYTFTKSNTSNDGVATWNISK